MSKITNDGLTRSGTWSRCFIAVSIWQQWASKGWLTLSDVRIRPTSVRLITFPSTVAVIRGGHRAISVTAVPPLQMFPTKLVAR